MSLLVFRHLVYIQWVIIRRYPVFTQSHVVIVVVMQLSGFVFMDLYERANYMKEIASLILLFILYNFAFISNSRSETLSSFPEFAPFGDCYHMECAQDILEKYNEKYNLILKTLSEYTEMQKKRDSILSDIVAELENEKFALKGCGKRSNENKGTSSADAIRADFNHYDRCLAALKNANARAQLAEATEKDLNRARQQITQANIALFKLADAGWRSQETGCRGVPLSASRAPAPGNAFACKNCRDLQWIDVAPARQAVDHRACASGRVGFARHPITGWDMKECENSGRCKGREALAVNDKTPVTYTLWQDVEEYLAWVNEELVSQGYRARLPRLAEWIAVAGQAPLRPGGRDREVQDLHMVEPPGVAVLPAGMKEWTQDCERWSEERCQARKLFAMDKNRRATFTQSERAGHETTGFRIVVESIVPAPLLTEAAAPPARSP